MSSKYPQSFGSQYFGVGGEPDPFEKLYTQIKQMKDGPAKTEAMRQLFQDYPGRMSAATDQVDKGFKMATMQPAGMTEGNRANPFSVDVGAGLLQHIGNAGMAYKGGQQMKQGRATMERMSADQEAINKTMANAVMYGPTMSDDEISAGLSASLQRGQASVLRGKKPDWMTDEEWLRMQQSGSYGT